MQQPSAVPLMIRINDKHLRTYFFFVLSETINKCSRLCGTWDTWSETVHYRPLVPTRRPHREGGMRLLRGNSLALVLAYLTFSGRVLSTKT